MSQQARRIKYRAPKPKCRAAAVLTAFRLVFPTPFRLACRAGRRPNWERFAASAGAEVFQNEEDDHSLAVFADDSCANRCGSDVRVYRRPTNLERGGDGRVDSCAIG